MTLEAEAARATLGNAGGASRKSDGATGGSGVPAGRGTLAAETGCGTGAGASDTAAVPVAPAAKRAPWHFKLLVVGVAGYMVYRIIWFIEWLPKHV